MTPSPRTQTTPGPIDVARLLDLSEWGRLQFVVVAFSALAVILDGFDNQLLGLSVPSLMADWRVGRPAFAPVFAIGFVGMLLGAAIAGYIGDRFGRRPALIASVLVFGVATLAVAFAGDITVLMVLRLISGMGLGGAIPIAGALTSEFAPLRGRAMAVSLTIVCVPAGGAVSGAVAAYILQPWGWRGLFVLGGAAALAIGLLLLAVLPESARFLAHHPARKPELVRLIQRLGLPADSHTEFTAPPAAHTTRSGIAALIQPPHRRDTLSLWLAFVFCTMSVYMAFNWLPSLLTSAGISVSAASSGLAAYNVGGVIGPVLCASFISRVGSRTTLLATSLCGSGMAFALGAIRPGAANVAWFTFGLAIFGFFVNATQTMLFALAAHLYPTNIRAKGVSFAAGVGRTGAILSSYLGAVLIQSGPSSYFLFQAATMAGAFIGLVLVAGHIPRLASTLLPSRDTAAS